MSGLDTSPFSERKGNRWVWIVPSVLVHVIVLAVWLMLPEAEPRKPGERKLTIKEEQAEELQDHVEEANLEQLREKVSELQSIKARMAQIRGQQMASVSEFEQDMVIEAPRDLARILREWIGIYEAVQADYERIESALNSYAEKAPLIREAAEKEITEGLRKLPQIKDFWSSFDGMGDRFEVAFYETAATLRALEVKLEWVSDPAVAARVEALKTPMAAVEEAHHEAWRAVPASWKRERSFARVTEDVEATIATIERFRQSEREGKAAVAQKRAELEAGIVAAEEKLKAVKAALDLANQAFEAIDRSQDREAWSAQRNAVRGYKNEERKLQRELNNLQRSLDRTQYKEDRKLANQVRNINNQFWHALPDLPDRNLIPRSIATQQAFMAELEDFANSLEGAP